MLRSIGRICLSWVVLKVAETALVLGSVKVVYLLRVPESFIFLVCSLEHLQFRE
jgi:hypothetical protein